MSQLSLHRIALSLDLAADLAPVEGDPNQLQQVVTNLLLNAADAVDGTAGGIRVHSRNAHLPAWGNAAVRAAACPKGCDLIDTTVRIGGLPSIRVARTQGGTEAIVHLDPVYGRSNHVTSEPCEDGVVASYACPRCRRSLAPQDPGWTTCGTCGAAAFAVQVTGRGEVAWCTRKGCSWSFWGAEEAEGARPVVEIAVEDQGRGIRPQDLARLFEPFFTTKGGRGTGLGLAVSWGIVEAHCGTIHVESSEGQGSRFTVRLPRAANADRVPEPAAA
jgi:signal transduction histidine kinase